MKWLRMIMLCLLMGYANISEQVIDNTDKMLIYQMKFADASNGMLTLDEVRRIPIYIKNYYKFDTELMRLTPTEYGTAGTCFMAGPFSYITLNKAWFESTKNELEIEQVIFHELGHCLLWLPHTHPLNPRSMADWPEFIMFKIGFLKERPRYLMDWCPSSYMHPQMISDKCINKHYNYYMYELFYGPIKFGDNK